MYIQIRTNTHKYVKTRNLTNRFETEPYKIVPMYDINVDDKQNGTVDFSKMSPRSRFQHQNLISILLILKQNQDIWQLVILSIIMAIGIPSNIIIIFVSTYFRKSMPPSSILVTNLAISGNDAFEPIHFSRSIY